MPCSNSRSPYFSSQGCRAPMSHAPGRSEYVICPGGVWVCRGLWENAISSFSYLLPRTQSPLSASRIRFPPLRKKSRGRVQGTPQLSHKRGTRQAQGCVLTVPGDGGKGDRGSCCLNCPQWKVRGNSLNFEICLITYFISNYNANICSHLSKAFTMCQVPSILYEMFAISAVEMRKS